MPTTRPGCRIGRCTLAKNTMNFLNPYIEIYIRPKELTDKIRIPFYREVLWLFSKNLENGLKMFQHRVNIILTDSEEKKKNKKFASIYEHSVKIDYEKFEVLNDNSKKEFLLEIIYNGFMELATEFSWDKEVINRSYQKSKKENYQFIYHTDFKSNRNRKDKGRIAITLKDNLVTFYSEIYNSKRNELLSAELLTTEETNFSWWRKIKEYGWFDKLNFGLKLMDGEVWIVSNKDKAEVKEVYNPKNKDIQEIENFLKKLKETPAYNIA